MGAVDEDRLGARDRVVEHRPPQGVERGDREVDLLLIDRTQRKVDGGPGEPVVVGGEPRTPVIPGETHDPPTEGARRRCREHDDGRNDRPPFIQPCERVDGLVGRRHSDQPLSRVKAPLDRSVHHGDACECDHCEHGAESHRVDGRTIDDEHSQQGDRRHEIRDECRDRRRTSRSAQQRDQSKERQRGQETGRSTTQNCEFDRHPACKARDEGEHADAGRDRRRRPCRCRQVVHAVQQGPADIGVGLPSDLFDGDRACGDRGNDDREQSDGDVESMGEERDHAAEYR